MLGFRLIGILWALAFTGAAQGQEALAPLNADEPALAAELVESLVHYPDDIVQVIFDATEYPEQIALAARYLNEPNSVQGKPAFNRAILALMQYPTLLQRLSTDLVWISELGRALAEDESLVWAQLKDRRQLPEGLASPVTVVPEETRVVYRSRPSSSVSSTLARTGVLVYVVHWDRHSHRRPLHPASSPLWLLGTFQQTRSFMASQALAAPRPFSVSAAPATREKDHTRTQGDSARVSARLAPSSTGLYVWRVIRHSPWHRPTALIEISAGLLPTNPKAADPTPKQRQTWLHQKWDTSKKKQHHLPPDRPRLH